MSFRTQISNPKAGYAYDRHGSDRLVVTFGSLLLPATGVPVWNFLRASEGIEADRLFLRDHREQWYQRGIVEHPSIVETEEWLDDIVWSGYRSVLFMGSSMGGFAAMLFGRLIGVDVYTINPQTSLPLDRTMGHERLWNAQLDAVLRHPPDDAVLDVADVKQYRGQTTIVYAEDRVDVQHAKRMEKSGRVTLVPRKFDNHLLVRHMTQTGEIARVLRGAA